MPKLVCISGMNRGEDYDLADVGEYTIGRGEANAITCIDTKASRTHCKVVYDGQSLFIEDLQSTNGTRVNNAYLTAPRYLQDGDHLQIGQTIFLVSSDAAPLPVYEPVNIPDASPYTFTHTSSVRKSLMARVNPELGYISYAVAAKR